MIDAYRVEQMFQYIGGVSQIVPGLAHNRSGVNKRGVLLVLLREGLGAEERADALAAAILRHGATRLDPAEVLALLTRAFHRPVAIPATCSPASVAAWIPEDR